jgi:hypothetical protein
MATSTLERFLLSVLTGGANRDWRYCQDLLIRLRKRRVRDVRSREIEDAFDTVQCRGYYPLFRDGFWRLVTVDLRTPHREHNVFEHHHQIIKCLPSAQYPQSTFPINRKPPYKCSQLETSRKQLCRLSLVQPSRAWPTNRSSSSRIPLSSSALTRGLTGQHHTLRHTTSICESRRWTRSKRIMVTKMGGVGIGRVGSVDRLLCRRRQEH